MTATPTQEAAGKSPEFSGTRQFSWFTPARRKPSEYENYSVGLQSGPDQWLKIGWATHFPDGSPPFSDENSRIRSTEWRAFRDPNKTWDRPYVAQANQEEQTLARLLPTLLANGAERMSPEWTKETLGRVYAAWPFVEYALFLTNSYGVRQAMSDTTQIPLVFQATDHLKLLQGIVIHLDELSTALPGFTDEGAREAWMSDPSLVPTRELVEHIASSTDWVEGAVVAALIFEPLVGRLAKLELFTNGAAGAGDVATPTVLATALHDAERYISTTQEMVRLVLADPTHGAANRAVLEEWRDTWVPKSIEAARALLGAFPGHISAAEREAALERVIAHQREVLDSAMGAAA